MDKSLCCYCGKKADGPMLTMGAKMAHADCVIQKLNELLDPDYMIDGRPARIVGYLAQERKRIVKDIAQTIMDSGNPYAMEITLNEYLGKLKGE